MKTLYKLTLVLIFAAGMLWGLGNVKAQTITAVSQSSSINHSQSITISGSDFGLHEDFHSDANKIIRVWDDFEEGDLKSNQYENWGLFNLPALELFENSSTRRDGPNNHKQYHRNNAGLGNLELKTGLHQEYFISHWIRFSDNFDICGGGTNQLKLTRFWSENGGANVYPAYNAGGFCLAIEGTSPEIMGYMTRIEGQHSQPELGEWHRWDIYVKRSTTASSNDGHLRCYIDTKLVYDYLRDTGGGKDYWGKVIEGDFDDEGSDFGKRVSIGSYFSGASADTYVDYDDIYFTHTLSRVELGNASTWELCTKSELQIPVSWSDGEIQIQINQGSYQNGDTAYLYVVDAEGNVSDGYGITFDGATNTPQNHLSDSFNALSIISGGGKCIIRQNNYSPSSSGNKLNIYDISGRLLEQLNENDGEFIWNTSTVHNGIYLMKLVGSDCPGQKFMLVK